MSTYPNTGEYDINLSSTNTTSATAQRMIDAAIRGDTLLTTREFHVLQNIVDEGTNEQ